MDAHGRSNFQTLQNAQRDTPVMFYTFGVIMDKGQRRPLPSHSAGDPHTAFRHIAHRWCCPALAFSGPRRTEWGAQLLSGDWNCDTFLCPVILTHVPDQAQLLHGQSCASMLLPATFLVSWCSAITATFFGSGYAANYNASQLRSVASTADLQAPRKQFSLVSVPWSRSWTHLRANRQVHGSCLTAHLTFITNLGCCGCQ